MWRARGLRALAVAACVATAYAPATLDQGLSATAAVNDDGEIIDHTASELPAFLNKNVQIVGTAKDLAPVAGKTGVASAFDRTTGTYTVVFQTRDVETVSWIMWIKAQLGLANPAAMASASVHHPRRQKGTTTFDSVHPVNLVISLESSSQRKIRSQRRTRERKRKRDATDARDEL